MTAESETMAVPGKSRLLVKIAGFCFLIGLLLLPFDTFPYFRRILREIGSVASFYPFTAGLVLFAGSLVFLRKFPLRVPSEDLSFKLAVLFFLWVGVSLAVNWGEISTAVFKGRSGGVKGILQFIMLAYCLIVSLYAFHVVPTLKNGSSRVELFILLSFAIPAIFSVLEILYLYKLSQGEWLTFLRPLISDDHRLYARLRSVSGEPTSFAFYCAFLAPWLMRRVISEKAGKLLLYTAISAYLLFLIILTLSKAAYIMTLSGLSIFLVLAYFRSLNRRRVVLAGGGLICLCWLFNVIAPTVTVYSGEVVRNPISGMFHGVGNMSANVRLAAQIATFRVANASPLFGVGFAQAGFHMHKYIHNWGSLWPEEVNNWRDGTPGTPWAPSHGLHARIAAETGYTGLILWLGMWISIGIALLRRTMRTTGDTALQGAVLCAAIFSCVLMGFNMDSFKFFEYWVSLGLGWVYLRTTSA